MADSDDFFERQRSLLGEAAFAAVAASHVAVFGVGGVGSWCCEALVRSGVHRLTLVDDDVVAPSNVNRQLPATAASIGEIKVEALRERLKAINPAAEIIARAARYTPENAEAFDLTAFDAVVDAIDSVPCKAQLIRHALSTCGLAFFSSMGAARRTDPSRVRTGRFSRVTGDGLARALRQRFKKEGLRPPLDFTCAWSDEVPSGEGSSVVVTATFGLHLAARVLDALISRQVRT